MSIYLPNGTAMTGSTSLDFNFAAPFYTDKATPLRGWHSMHMLTCGLCSIPARLAPAPEGVTIHFPYSDVAHDTSRQSRWDKEDSRKKRA